MSTRTDPGPHPGRRQATASGSGSRARARRASAAAPPATCTSASTSTPHPVFGRDGRQPDAHRAGHLPRGRARRRDQGADPQGPAGDAAASRRARPTAAPSGCAGRGAARKDGTRGDLLVTVEVQVPQQLTDKAREALEEFRDGDARMTTREPSCWRTGQSEEPWKPAIRSPTTPPSTSSRWPPSCRACIPQTLRQYDRLGLVSPGPHGGRGRRYSTRDIVMLREVQRLSQDEGINLAGIKRILELQRSNDDLRNEVMRLAALLEEMGNELESTRAVAARLAHLRGEPAGRGDLVPIRQTSVVLWRQQHNQGD